MSEEPQVQASGTKLKLVICTPFYEVKAYSPYIISLIDSIKTLDLMGIPWEYYELSGDSYVDRAKNSLVHRFLQDKEATHLFMVDSDESWDPVGFMRLLGAIIHGAEVVGGLYPCKNNWKFFGGYAKTDPDGHPFMGKAGEIPVVQMECIPGGFVCYSRKAFERTRPNLKVYKSWGINDGEGDGILECFRCHIEADGSRIGEDIYFQNRYKEMGGTIWCVPDITISHYGVEPHVGNYWEHLQQETKKVECAKALAAVMESPIAKEAGV